MKLWVAVAAVIVTSFGHGAAATAAETEGSAVGEATSGRVAAHAVPLPRSVQLALTKAGIPSSAVGVWVRAVDAPAEVAPRVAHRAHVAMNPASVMKLVTTTAALDLLGPDYTWKTLVYFGGPVVDGVLQGDLILKGTGDPKLVLEHIDALLRAVQARGVRSIAGDIVLDRSLFNVPAVDPGAFDGEPLRPYNASPDALLLNFKAIIFTFTPDIANRVAQVKADPPMAQVALPDTVPLKQGACEGYRDGLRADFSDPHRVVFAGAYPSACGEMVWPVLYADANSYAPRVLSAMWAQLGGQLTGRVRYDAMPQGARLAFEHASPPLAEVVRDVNKFSNNVQAQQMFLSLPTAAARLRSHVGLRTATFDAARKTVRQWWGQRLPGVEQPVMENGSGLSRKERASAYSLGQLLQFAAGLPAAQVLADSLPVAGIDGTMRNAKLSVAHGNAQLKTGSLRDTTAVAGYVTGRSGQRYVLVAIVNHPNRAREALSVLIDWVAQD